MKFFKMLLAVGFIAGFHISSYAGDCMAQARCKNGVATCSASSKNTGQDGNRIDAFCGELNRGDKHLSCWIEKRDGKTVVDVVCCDANGNAVQGGWNRGSGFNTAMCVSYQ